MASVFGPGFDSPQLHTEPHSNECGFFFITPAAKENTYNAHNDLLVKISGLNILHNHIHYLFA